MKYEKISLSEIYSTRLKQIFDGALDRYTVYIPDQVDNNSIHTASVGPVVIKPREIEI